MCLSRRFPHRFGFMGAAIALWASWLLFASLAQAHGPVSLAVQEALPNDPKSSTFQLIKGVDRKKELVTFGVPFPPDTFFFETNKMQMLLNNKIFNDAQYHIERRWPSRRVKWLRVHLLMDIKANEQNKTLLLGSSDGVPPNDKKLLTEESEHYVIKTGKATFWVNKKRFSLFDKVEIDGKAMLASTAQPGIILTSTDGTKYEAALDDQVQYTVEDNGPFYVALIAKGKHRDKDGKALLGFTVRMHFIAGKSRVKIDYTLRNASKERLENVSFQSAALFLRTDWDKGNYLVKDHQGESKGALTDAAKLRLFQGENAFPTIRGKGYDKPVWPTGISGYKLTLDGKELKQGGRGDYIQLFYAQSRAADGRAVTAGTRFAAGHWPQGLGLDGDGTVHIGVFPEGNDKPYTIRFGSHITRECVLYFEDKAEDSPRDEFFRFQYPLVGKPAYAEWYNTEGMFLFRLSSFKEEADYYQAKGWPVDDRPDATLKRRPSFAIVRHLDRSGNAPIDQFSQGMIHGLNFLREDALWGGAYFLMAEQWAQYNASHAIHRSDDYDDKNVAKDVPGLVDTDGNPKPYTALPGADQLPSTSPIWKLVNHHGNGLAWWSLTAANRRQLQAYYDWGETLMRLKHDPNDPLSLAWRIYHLADYAALTELKEYQKTAWELVKAAAIDKQAEPGTSGGTHPQRGYFLPASQATQTPPTVSSFLLGGLMIWAYGTLANHAGSLPEQIDQLYDLLDGMADFVSHELWHQASDSPGSMGLRGTYDPTKSGVDPTKAQDWSGGLNDAFAALYFGYTMTCDKRFADQADLVLKAAAHNPAKTYWFQDRPTRHMLQDMLQKPELHLFWHPLKIKVERNGSEATLSWTKPEFATLYRIKYADKTIVTSLGYDPKTGKYEHDPKDHIPFWAATNVADEPGGGDVSPGETQQVVIKGLDPNKTYDFKGRFRSQELCGKTTEDREKPVANETNREAIDKDGGENGQDGAPEKGHTGCNCSSIETNGASLCLFLLLLGLAGRRRRRA